jgi:hypothetical protein
MKKLTVLFGLSFLIFSTSLFAQVSQDEITLLRQQIDMLTNRLDQLEQQNDQLAQSLEESNKQAAAKTEAVVDARIDAEIDEAVAEKVGEQLAAVSWAERIRWAGDFRYRYENIDYEGKDGRNRNRIRARTHLEADLSPTLQVGFGLSTGGDDPVSGNVTLGGGGTKKDIKLDLAYFDWSGLTDTNIVGGKVKNFLVRPAKTGLQWDGDWRPEGLGGIWDNGTFFAQGLGTWLVGDSKATSGTIFAWVGQAGVNLKLGETGKLKLGGGYASFDIAGLTPLFGDPEDFYGNSFVFDPITGELVYKYNYHVWEAFAEYGFKLGDRPMLLFADFTHNTEADDNNTGYLIGAKYGSTKARGDWQLMYFYEKLEADAVVGLLADSDFGNGGTNAKGSVFSGAYAFSPNWNFKATYFVNKVLLDTPDPKSYNRFQMDLNFKFK